MIRYLHIRALAIGLSVLAWLTPVALADNGIIVSGQVTGIDPINQIMRVHVTGVNGFALYGSAQTNYVDYLVSPNTVVVGSNNQFVSLSNVLVGSQIQMQFAGAYASVIVLSGNSSFTNYSGGYVTAPPVYRNNSVSNSQNYGPVTSYPSIVIRSRNQNNWMQNNTAQNQHVVHNRHAVHSNVGATHVPPSTTTTTQQR